MSHKPYVVGIDLGTSHCALAYWQKGSEKIDLLEIDQIHSPGKTHKKSVLPSVTYLPHDKEISEDAVRLPWESEGNPSNITGTWARERSLELPDRSVASAKSWLCSNSADRMSRILPWQSEVPGKMSPVEALTGYLSHLKKAFEFDRKNTDDSDPVAIETVVLTVPASFDEVARNLTRDAAKGAGFSEVQLLEEPQSAFYSWIARNDQNWREMVSPGDLVLVCDVGGGTTDFSLIAVSGDDQGDLHLERVSVGDHLLLGGDNMDLALAWHISQKLEAQGQKPDQWQFRALIGAARQAKEELLSDQERTEFPVSVASKGSGLLSGTLTCTLTREDVESVLLDGFVPASGPEDFPAENHSLGFQELGLNYESEPAVSKHLARFLHRSRQNVESDEALKALASEALKNSITGSSNLLLPTAVLFNGGVFKSSAMKDRVLNLLNSWSPQAPVRELTGGELDLAVANGAAYLGRSRSSGHGIRIAAGIGRSYYLGIESLMMAVPGMKPEVKGLCVVPQGAEEGSTLPLPDKQFGLVTGKKVSFRFFSSPARAGDKPGTLVNNAGNELDETSRLEIELPVTNGGKTGEPVPVRLEAKISDIGMLQLSLQHTLSDKVWDLEFNIRPEY